MTPDSKPPRLIVVLSTERSGSTLLSQMLGAHTRIVAPPELHLFSYPTYADCRRGWPPAIRSLIAAYEMLGVDVDEAELDRRFGDRPIEPIYDELLDRCGPDRTLVDKTPAYARHPGALERAEGYRPFFVWLVRHPLAVAASRIELVLEIRRKERGFAPRMKYPLYRIRHAIRRWTGQELLHELERWSDAHARIESFLAGVDPARWHRVQYEALVRDPDGQLTALCRRISIEPEPAMLDPRSQLPTALGWDVGDQKIRSHERIDPSVADRWREVFDASQIDARTRALMERIGVVDDGVNGSLGRGTGGDP